MKVTGVIMGKTKRWDRQRFIHMAVGAVILPLGAATTLLWPLAGAAHTETAPRAPRMSLPAAGAPGGDIPDSAVYLRYTGRGFSVEYVEGWLQTAAAHGVTFSDKDSSVIVDLRPRLGGDLSAYVQRIDLSRLAHTPGFRREGLTRDSIGGYRALRLTYRGRLEPDAVTGKTVALQVDRYYVQGPHALAVMTLATPLGVDNVDGFRRIAHSFRFR